MQACQAAHAALDFTFEHPAVAREWHEVSNTIVIAAARDELALTWLAADAADAGFAYTMFREPDLDDTLTAVALEPAAHRLVRKFPLALRERSNAHVLTTTTPGGES